MSGRSPVPPPVTAVMEEAESWLPGGLARVEERLAQIVAAHGETLGREAGLTLAAGGKRMRPLLVLLCAGPEGGDLARRGAVAVELVHMATLVHDDVLDRAPLRRGRATVVARAGREMATNVGDLLFSQAFAELGGGPQVRLLAEAAVDLARGELKQRADAFDLGLSRERYLVRCRLKTASLFACACVIGDPGLPAQAREAVGAFGHAVGLAFQLLDDVLDVSGPEERTGKARGTDLLDGTVTLPLIEARDCDPSLGAIDLSSLDARGAAEVCDRIAATGALERVRAQARDRVDEAKRGLSRAGLEEEQRRLLELVGDGVVARYT